MQTASDAEKIDHNDKKKNKTKQNKKQPKKPRRLS